MRAEGRGREGRRGQAGERHCSHQDGMRCANVNAPRFCKQSLSSLLGLTHMCLYQCLLHCLRCIFVFEQPVSHPHLSALCPPTLVPLR